MTKAAKELLARLVLVNSLDDVPSVLSSISVHGAELLATLDETTDELASAGRPQEAALLRFLRPHVERGLPEWARTSSADLAALVVRAAALPDMLAQFRFARANPVLLTETALQRAYEVFATPETPAPVRDGHAALFALLGVLGTNPEIAVEARLTWAAVLRRQGRLARSLFHARRASDNAPARLKAGALGAIAAVYHDAGDLQSSIEVLRSALAAEEQPRTQASVHWALARNLRGLGRSAEALEHVDAALSVLADLPWRDAAIWELLNLRGLLHEDGGRYEYGAADFQLAKEEAAQSGDRVREFQSWTDYAGSLLKANRTRAAQREFQQIHQQIREWDIPGLLPAALNNLAHACSQAGDLDTAAIVYGEALALQEHQMTSSAMTSLIGLGDVLRDKGSDGRVLYQMALATGIAAGDENAVVWCTSRMTDTEDPEVERQLRALLDAPETAQWWFVRVHASEALARYLASYGDRGEAIDLLRSLMAEAERRDALIGSIRAHVQLARLLAANPGDRSEALAVLRSARTTLLDHLARSPDQRRRGEIAGEFIDVYETLIDLLVGCDQPSQQDVEAAFDLHEEARARSFLASIADLPHPAPATVPTALAEQESALLAKRHDLRRDLAVLQGGVLRTRLSQLGAVEKQLAAVYDAIAVTDPDYARTRRGLPVTLVDVRKLLARHAPAEGATIVSYFCGKRTTTCFTVSSHDGQLQLHRAPIGAAELTAIAGRLSKTFNGDPTAFPPAAPIHPRRPHRRSLRELDDLGPRILPKPEVLDERPLVCVVPHGPLHLIPVHALPDAAGMRLAGRAAVTYAPSLSLLAHVLAQPSARPSRALVVAVAAREDPDPAVFEDDARILRNAGWTVTDLRGPAATKPATLAELERHDLVHLTCHGYTHPHDHLESGLVLADAEDRPTKFTDSLSLRQRRRTVLRALDVAQHRKSIRLVTLRACASGRLTPDNAGDEFSGLSRSLLGAGAAATITALWNVDQRSSGELLRETYRIWLAGVPLWRALWTAQQAFVADNTRAWRQHLYHWAPLVLTGDWR